MADVQTNLLGFILTKLHADVARIEGMIHQVHVDVEYLVNANQISRDDAHLILSKVPEPVQVDLAPTDEHLAHSSFAYRNGLNGGHINLPPPIVNGNVNGNGNINGAPAPSPPRGVGAVHGQAPPLPSAKRAVPPIPKKVQARALWDYNIDGEEPKDLTFYKNDVIEIVAETNEDWWTGKVNGRTGLFPANHVEKFLHALPPQLSAPANHSPQHPSSYDEPAPAYAPYRSTHAAMQQRGPGGGANPVGLVPAPEEEGKKDRYENLKNTMATSAAGGFGFGAGAALGSGLVRAIF